MVSKVAVSRKQIGGEVPMVVNHITDNCIYTGLFGSIDSARMAVVTDKVTHLCVDTQIACVIIDLSNVDAIDTAVASELIRLGDTVRLVGVTPIFCGINGVLARTMVTAGVDLGKYKVSRGLRCALLISYEVTGYEVVKKQKLD